MTQDPSIHIDFPQYAPIWERVGESPNVMLISKCPFCGKEITNRTWLGFEPPETDEEIQAMVVARLKDSREDREVYWTHLVTAHPEKFE